MFHITELEERVKQTADAFVIKIIVKDPIKHIFERQHN